MSERPGGHHGTDISAPRLQVGTAEPGGCSAEAAGSGCFSRQGERKSHKEHNGKPKIQIHHFIPNGSVCISTRALDAVSPCGALSSPPAPQRAGDAERCAVPTAPQLPGRRSGGSSPFPDTLARVSRAAEGARGRVAAGTRAGTAPAERGGPGATSPGSGLAPSPVASPTIYRVTGTALLPATGDGLKPLTA